MKAFIEDDASSAGIDVEYVHGMSPLLHIYENNNLVKTYELETLSREDIRGRSERWFGKVEW